MSEQTYMIKFPVHVDVETKVKGIDEQEAWLNGLKEVRRVIDVTMRAVVADGFTIGRVSNTITFTLKREED